MIKKYKIYLTLVFFVVLVTVFIGLVFLLTPAQLVL